MSRARWWIAMLLGMLAISPSPANPLRSGFGTSALNPTDDGSSEAQSLGFSVNFFGQTFGSLYVNANGNVSFGSALSDFAPVPLGQLNAAIIAPFFADVDTTLQGQVQYGKGTVDGHNAFGATWKDVGFYGSSGTKTNDFQMLLIDRSDTGAGNFDVEFNYDRINWESGDFNGGIGGVGGSPARVGFTNGSALPGTFYELPGSGVSGSFLDGAETALAGTMLNSTTPGRIVLFGREGQLSASDPLLGPNLPETETPRPSPLPGDSGPGGSFGAPEPHTFALAGLGLSGLGLVQAFRRTTGSARSARTEPHDSQDA
ncbi:MAG: hypothetical protein LC104_21260 [Bacteroidales bacterium]|nr:hypothetical protein [Bacteroidales bacterium]